MEWKIDRGNLEHANRVVDAFPCPPSMTQWQNFGPREPRTGKLGNSLGTGIVGPGSLYSLLNGLENGLILNQTMS